jgi:hypothetical protein
MRVDLNAELMSLKAETKTKKRCYGRRVALANYVHNLLPQLSQINKHDTPKAQQACGAQPCRLRYVKYVLII